MALLVDETTLDLIRQGQAGIMVGHWWDNGGTRWDTLSALTSGNGIGDRWAQIGV